MSDLQTVLSQGADPNEQDRDGRTPLIHAAIDNKVEFAKLLLESDANVDAQDNLGYASLHYAAQNWFFEMAGLLIRYGAAIDLEDNNGNTPLGRATFASQGRGELISLLLKAGADRNHPNKYGQTPLNLSKLIANYNVSQYFE